MCVKQFDSTGAILLVDLVEPCYSAIAVLFARLPMLPTKRLLVRLSYRYHVQNRNLPRKGVILVLWPLNSINGEDRLKRFAHSNDRDTFDQCLSQSADKLLSRFRGCVLWLLREIRVQASNKLRLAASSEGGDLMGERNLVMASSRIILHGKGKSFGEWHTAMRYHLSCPRV